MSIWPKGSGYQVKASPHRALVDQVVILATLLIEGLIGEIIPK